MRRRRRRISDARNRISSCSISACRIATVSSFSRICGAAGSFARELERRCPRVDAIEEALHDGGFDEVILSTLPPSVSRWLHLDLPRRVAHLGIPVTTIVAGERATVAA